MEDRQHAERWGKRKERAKEKGPDSQGVGGRTHALVRWKALWQHGESCQAINSLIKNKETGKQVETSREHARILRYERRA